MTSAPLRLSFAEAAGIDEDRRAGIVGGKGAALARMVALGLRVPPGFTLTTHACREIRSEGWSGALDAELLAGLRELESATGRRLGDADAPLVVSIRSGAEISMPGMLDTVLNAGSTESVAEALGSATGDARFGWDTHRRFVQSYARVVLGADTEPLRAAFEHSLGPDEGGSLGAGALASAVRAFGGALADAGYVIPVDPEEQIRTAARAVFASWESDRARAYRRVEGISEDLATAATVQVMTFGNQGVRSGAGVAFSRDPSTGARGVVGDFLVGAQGEDVVGGTHATRPIGEMREVWPDVAAELDAAAGLLERDLADLAEIEFTVEDGTLWFLQVRRARRSARAALRLAVDMAEEPDFPVTRAEAVARVAHLLDAPPTAPPDDTGFATDHDLLATGVAASPGRAVGAVCTTIDGAVTAGSEGHDIVLFRRETSPADIAGIAAARGLVTTLGGIGSHAAVVARGWGVPAVVGVAGIEIDTDGIRVDDEHVATGSIVTVDGDAGRILRGAHATDGRELAEVPVLQAWREEVDAHRPRPVVASSEAATSVACERVLALKGTSSAEVVAQALGCSTVEVEAVFTALVAAKEVHELPDGRLRLVPAATARVDERYAVDAARLGPTIEPLLDDFRSVDDLLKRVLTAWQVKGQGGTTRPNDHDDLDYDKRITDRLRNEVHAAIAPIIDAVAAVEGRFSRYRDRLASALRAIEDGDRQMVAHPLRDSYHTVWFELHEELIRLTGRKRADEASAGRG